MVSKAMVKEQRHGDSKQKSFIIRSVLEQAKIQASLSASDKLALYDGMLITRATDNALKQLFLSGEITYLGKGFQGKGFRSLGQEAIYGAMFKLNIGEDFIQNGTYVGDVAGPLIRDLGVFLAMSNNDVATAINAQAGKASLPSDGRDLHVFDMSKGVLPPAAPLAIATCTLIGCALAFKRRKEKRVALSFIGDGGTSLGEWHEAINFAAVQQLPMIFCVQNNQTALSTAKNQQCAAQRFADKALGYGIKSLVIDGNDILAVVAAFKFAADEARAGRGPLLIELLTMRMCGHAHHDDMLYLGAEPDLDFDIKPLKPGGYADKALFEQWQKKDPIKVLEASLLEENLLSEQKITALKKATLALVNQAIAQVKSRPWPRLHKPDSELVFYAPWIFSKTERSSPIFAKDGSTYLSAICEGVKRVFKEHKNSLMIGEDVAAPYGNAFMMFKPIMHEFSDRFINTPISENAIVGACVGMALNGFLPIGEMQFNDFVACAMDQVTNNAARLFFRTGLKVPMVLRMPYGGLRRAGPFHSQDTTPWFYCTPGLKIMAPSTPIDAMLMLKKAVLDPDPVLFYEHIALYRDPKIKQNLAQAEVVDIEGAAIVEAGSDLTIISYGAYVHVARNVCQALKQQGVHAEVIDLRYLAPIDFATIFASVKKTSRALLCCESAKTGSVLESVASTIADELFSYLDAPVKVLGSRDISVPYAPSLEDDYLLNEEQIKRAALDLIAF